MKTQRTPDGITWEGLPSLFRELVPPQSAARFGVAVATQTFSAPVAFWRKLAQSLLDTTVRALWVPYLGKGIENAAEDRRNLNSLDRIDLETFIAEAAAGFGDLLRESLRQPLLLAEPVEQEIVFAQLLLTNGATAVLRVDTHQATLHDCFFSRPARECPADAADSQTRYQAALHGMVLRHAAINEAIGAAATGDRMSLRTDSARTRITRFDLAPQPLRWNGMPAFQPEVAACLPELDAATAHLDAVEQSRKNSHSTHDSTLQRAAYRLATALGYRRLFGIPSTASAAESSLPLHLLPLVTRELTSRLKRWTVADLSHGQTPSSLWADEDRLAGLFESRMEAWAVFVEIDRAAGDSFIGCDPTASLDPDAFDQTLDAMESFDAVLQSHEHEFLTAPSRLIANYRTLLASRYRDCAPWWLCESLSPAAR